MARHVAPVPALLVSRIREAESKHRQAKARLERAVQENWVTILSVRKLERDAWQEVVQASAFAGVDLPQR